MCLLRIRGVRACVSFFGPIWLIIRNSLGTCQVSWDAAWRSGESQASCEQLRLDARLYLAEKSTNFGPTTSYAALRHRFNMRKDPAIIKHMDDMEDKLQYIVTSAYTLDFLSSTTHDLVKYTVFLWSCEQLKVLPQICGLSTRTH